MLSNKNEEIRLLCMIDVFESLVTLVESEGDKYKQMELESYRSYFYNPIILNSSGMCELITVCNKLDNLMYNNSDNAKRVCKALRDITTAAHLKQTCAISDVSYTESLERLTCALRRNDGDKLSDEVNYTIDDIYERLYKHMDGSGKLRSYFADLINLSYTSFSNRLTRKSLSLKDIITIMNN